MVDGIPNRPKPIFTKRTLLGPYLMGNIYGFLQIFPETYPMTIADLLQSHAFLMSCKAGQTAKGMWLGGGETRAVASSQQKIVTDEAFRR